MEGRELEPWPREALPDCASCPKPELDETSDETLVLWDLVNNQQTFNQFSGQRLGLRMEAVVAALDELCDQGRVTDRARAFRRIWLLDRTYNEIDNAKRAAEDAADKRRAGRDAPAS